MTADDATETSIDPGAAADQSINDRLLALQRIDTETDQLKVRRERLPEREQLVVRTEQLAVWERRRAEMRARIDELSTSMEVAEQRGGGLRADKARLEAQLKTVIAPREAEALMHEIATVDEQLDELDTGELADLSELTTTEEELTVHLSEEGALRDALRRDDDALGVAVADIDREIDGLDDRHVELRDSLDEPILTRYDRVRGQLGVAVARLEVRRCSGCHLDLSAAEVDTAKEESASTGITDCPQCGRMLVV